MDTKGNMCYVALEPTECVCALRLQGCASQGGVCRQAAGAQLIQAGMPSPPGMETTALNGEAKLPLPPAGARAPPPLVGLSSANAVLPSPSRRRRLLTTGVAYSQYWVAAGSGSAAGPSQVMVTRPTPPE